MQNKVVLKIYEIVGGPVWVSTDDGQKVYEKIAASFKAGRPVELSFANRGNLITAFLNAAVGQLYGGQFTDEFLLNNLSFVDISKEDRDMLDRAIENAKRYFANRPQFDAAWQREVGDDEE